MTNLTDIILEMPSEERIDLFAHLAHELAAPLTRVIGFSDLMVLNDNLPFDTCQYFINVRNNAEELDKQFRSLPQQESTEFKNTITRMGELLSYLSPLEKKHNFTNPISKSYQGKINLSLRQLHYAFHELLGIGEMDTFHFERYLNIYTILNKDVLENSGIKFYFQMDSNLETKAHYNLELNNLIGNAIKHANPNMIRVSVKTNHLPYLVRVHDDGKGVNSEKIYQEAINKKIVSSSDTLSKQEKIDLVFKKGITTSNSQAPELIYGTSQGLGLSMVKECIEQKGGKLWVKSEPSNTRFYFTIPEHQVVK